jgi:hypothetical protein
MCDTADDGVGISNSVSKEEQLKRGGLSSADLSELMPFARQLANARENRDSHIGFVGYNKTVPGNKVLIAVDREYDQAVPNAVAAALREKGARVDILTADMGNPDREFDYLTRSRSSCAVNLGIKILGAGRGCRTLRTSHCGEATIC